MGDARLDQVRPDQRRPSWLEPGRKTRRSGNLLPWITAVLAISLVAIAAFLLGRGSGARMAPPPAMTLPVATEAPPAAPPPIIRTPEPRPITGPPVEAPALARAAHEGAPLATAKPGPKAEQLRAAGEIAAERRREGERQEMLARDAAGRRPPPPPPPPPFPRFGPPGQVVQLGAYGSQAQAEAAAALFRERYRGLLATLPTSVSPYRPRGAQRPSYRVQFLAPSTLYAEVTCQRLRAARKSCVIVY